MSRYARNLNVCSEAPVFQTVSTPITLRGKKKPRPPGSREIALAEKSFHDCEEMIKRNKAIYKAVVTKGGSDDIIWNSIASVGVLKSEAQHANDLDVNYEREVPFSGSRETEPSSPALLPTLPNWHPDLKGTHTNVCISNSNDMGT